MGDFLFYVDYVEIPGSRSRAILAAPFHDRGCLSAKPPFFDHAKCLGNLDSASSL